MCFVAESCKHITKLTTHANTSVTNRSFFRDLPPTGHHLFQLNSCDTQHFSNTLMMDSGTMSSQAVLIQCTSSATGTSDGFLVFPVGVSRQFPDGCTHTGNTVCFGMVCILLHHEPVTERSCLLV